jgi:hypothetical protein
MNIWWLHMLSKNMVVNLQCSVNVFEMALTTE